MLIANILAKLMQFLKKLKTILDFKKMRYKDQATTVFSEIASIIESSDNAENNIYDIVDFMISIMNKDQLNQVEDMLTNQYPED